MVVAASEIKTTLKLDGEAKFKSAISGAKKELTALKAEMKAQVAAFKAQGDAMGAARAEADGLREQQKQQEEIVRALQQALEEATAKYGENSQQVQNYRIQLANAQTALVDMGTAADDAAANVENMSSGMDSIEDVESAADSAADSLGDMADEVDTLDSKGGMDKLQDGLKMVGSVAGAALDVVKELYNTVGKSSTWADDLLTLSQTTGIDTQTLQQMQYASKIVDTSVETITGSINKLRKNMNSDTKVEGFTEWMATLGESGKQAATIYDNAGNIKNATDYFWQVMQAMHDNGIDLTKDTTAAGYLQQMFGMSVDELQPLINGLDQYKQAMKDADIVPEAQVQTLGKYNDGLETLTTSMETLQNVWSATLAPVFDAFNNGLTETIQGITKWLLDSDVSAMLEGVTKTIGDVMGMIASMANGDISFQELLDTMKGWLEADGEGSFSDMVSSSIVNLIGAIQTGIEALFKPNENGDSVYSTLIESSAALVNGLLDGISQAFVDMMNDEDINLSGTMSDMVLGLLTGFCNAVEALFDFSNEDTLSLYNAIGDFVIKLFEGLFDGIFRWIDSKLGTNLAGDSNESKERKPMAGGGRHKVEPEYEYDIWFDVDDVGLSDEAVEGLQEDVSNVETEFETWLSEGSAEAIPSDIQTAIDSQRYTADVGLSVGSISGYASGIANWASALNGGRMNSYDVGTDYVPYDQIAMIHKGERILTADENKRYGSGGGVDLDRLAAQIVSGMAHVSFNIDSNTVGAFVAPSVNEILARG